MADDDQWVILGGPKVSPAPKVIPDNVQTVEISNETLTTVFVNAVTSKPEVEANIESPLLPVHGNGLSTNSPHASSNGTNNGEKIHHFGNSTGIMTADRLSVCYGPSVHPSRRFLLLFLFLSLFLVFVFFLFHPVYFVMLFI